MDNVIFYQPPASSSQPRCLPGATTSLISSGASIASLSVRQTVLPLGQGNEISKDQVVKPRDVSDLSSGQRSRYDIIQKQDDLTATRNPLDSDEDNDLPDIDELLSGMMQKNNSAGADPNGGDDHDFIDIDYFLPGIQRKCMPASANPNVGGMPEMVDNRTRGGSRPDSSRSTAGSNDNPIILSDDELVGAKSKTHRSDLDVDVRAKSDSDPLRIAGSELADGDGFGLGAALISDRLITNYQDNNNNHNNGVFDKTQLRLSADRPRSVSPDAGSDTQASELQVGTDITQESTSSVDLDVTKGSEDEGFDASAEGNDKDNDDTRSTRGRTFPAVSNKNPASDGDISLIASPHQTGLKNNHSTKHLRRGATRSTSSKRPRTTASIGLASAASTASTLLQSSTEPRLRGQIAGAGQEMADDGGADDSDDKDYDDLSDAASGKRGCRPRSRKRVRRTKDNENNGVQAYPTHSIDASYQAAAATSCGSVQESEEIPIHGYFTLKSIESKVVYCLTFSQELLPCQHPGRRGDFATDLDKSQSAASVADPNPQWEIRKIIGQKIVGRERHYRVEWKDTWMPESELAGAKELVDAFTVNNRNGSIERPLKRGRMATGQCDARGEEEPKKRRGRPRKQT